MTKIAANASTQTDSAPKTAQVEGGLAPCVVETDVSKISLSSDIVIDKPAAGETVTLSLEAGRDYMFQFAEADIKEHVQDGKNLTFVFADGSKIQLENYAPALKAEHPAKLAFVEPITEGALADILKAIKEDTAVAEDTQEKDVQAEVHKTEVSDAKDATPPTEEALKSAAAHDVAEIEPASGDAAEKTANADDEMAEVLAKIQPAAGPAAARGGASSGHGYGFQSSFDPQGVISLNDVGPIDPTALVYGLTRSEEYVFINEDEALPNLSPKVTALSAEVYEDNTVSPSFTISPQSSNGALTIVISGIAQGWNVSNEAYDSLGNQIGTGVFNAANGTWTISLPAGTQFNGAPVFTPPADSDADLIGLQLTVSERDAATGQSGSSSTTFDIVVDAVADAPQINAQDSKGNEGDTLNIDLSALTGEQVHFGAAADGSETISYYEISGVPAGFTLSAGIETAPGSGVYRLTSSEIANLQITPNDPNFSGSLNLTATVFTQENPVDGEFDLTNNNAQASDAFVLTWGAVADQPVLNVQDAQVKEDGHVFIPVDARLTDTDGSEFLTVKVDGVPAGWTFVGAGWVQTGPNSYEITLPAGQNYADGFTLTPPADSDIDLTGLVVTAVSAELSNNSSSDIVKTIDVIVDAVADAPVVDGADNAGREGAALDVVIKGAAGDIDGSEHVQGYEITGVPDGFSFNKGTNLGGGVWSFSPAEIAGLKITPPANYVGSLDLKVTIMTAEGPVDGEFDTSDNTASASDVFRLVWSPVANPPSVEINQGVENAQVKEDGSVDVPLVAALDPNGSGNEVLTVTISGIDAKWGFVAPVGTYNPATGIWSVTLAPGQDLSTVLKFTPPADSDIDLTGLVVTASAYEPATGTTSQATPDGLNIIVDAVADAPVVDGADNAGREGAALDVVIKGAAGDIDGSEHVQGYEITGVPDGFSFNKGTNLGGGVWSFSPAEIAGLKITPPANYVGSLDLKVTIMTAEGPVDGEFDTSDNTASASDVFHLNWTPVVHNPTISVNNGVDNVIVKEDGTVDVGITAHLGANPAAGEYLTVTVTGIQSSWGTFSAPVGTYNPATGTWTVVLAPGQDLSTVMTFKPNADKDIDLSGLVATAVSYDPASGLSANATDGFKVIVDAVADIPNLSVSNAAGEEGSTIPLTISTSVNDTDGSEIIEVVKISGLPAGATLTAGTYNAATGVWSLSVNQLVGLGIKVHDGAPSVLTLRVESVAYEKNTSGTEVDLTDNRASAVQTITIDISRDDVPVIKTVQDLVVDETDLAPTTSAHGQITVDYGTDNPGKVIGNGSFVIGSLKSNGVNVVVTYNAATGTYTGKAGTQEIFTLKISNDGSYDFVLKGTIDHPNTTDHNDVLPLQFGFNAVDSEGDVKAGYIKVNVYDDGLTAFDDFAKYDMAIGSVSGNVITNDDLSHDMPNTVSIVSYGANSVNVLAGTGAVIDGEYGRLHIYADGTYTYTAFSEDEMGLNPVFMPTATDVSGVQSSISKNGITISVANTGSYDLVWVNNAYGHGLGIDNLSVADDLQAWPQGETFKIDFEKLADHAAFTVCGLKSNDEVVDYGLDYVVTFADGSTQTFEYQYQPSSIVNGSVTIELDSADFGGKLISSISIASLDSGDYFGAPFLLCDVSAHYVKDCDCIDQFVYTLRDADGDTDTAILTIECTETLLIVGTNTNDIDGSTVPHLVGGSEGVIVGATGNDILIGDAGGSYLQEQKQDYNFVFILDYSDSMGETNDPASKISLLRDAVENLLSGIKDYGDGDIKVHIVPFNTQALASETFTITHTGEYQMLLNYLDTLDPSGFTNYEDPMMSAISWLKSGQPLGGNAVTTTYFISDGEPNRAIDAAGAVFSAPATVVMGEISGTDGTNEIAMLKSLSDEVIAVGVNIGSGIMNLHQIDSDGVALNIDDPRELTVALAGTNPVGRLDALGDDVLKGHDGNDIIFGDAVYTDDLALSNGLPTEAGSGWEVFERLENGQSAANPDWDRADTIQYIRDNAVHLSQESVDDQGYGRQGGHDVINGGAGDDLIFGQEGHDVINGGAGNDVLYGGSGADTFVYESINDGQDHIVDFNSQEGDMLDISSVLSGFDPLTQDIADYVIVTHDAGNTIVSVDVSGQAGTAGSNILAILDGVTDFDINTSVQAA